VSATAPQPPRAGAAKRVAPAKRAARKGAPAKARRR
jgi:hypothetical protein